MSILPTAQKPVTFLATVDNGYQSEGKKSLTNVETGDYEFSKHCSLRFLVAPKPLKALSGVGRYGSTYRLRLGTYQLESTKLEEVYFVSQSHDRPKWLLKKMESNEITSSVIL